jgi:peptide/nickel transport system permease protein
MASLARPGPARPAADDDELTPSWGGVISDAVNNEYHAIDPMFMVIPGLAIFLTVMAFNLFGGGLRDALDPRSSR